VSGEWFGKGGPVDTPPITWVSSDQMNNIITSVNNYQSHATGEKPVSVPYHTVHSNGIPFWCSSMNCPMQDFDFRVYDLPGGMTSNADALGMSILLYKTPLFSGGRYYPWAYGTLICTSNEIMAGEQSFEKEIFVSAPGPLQLSITAKPTCYFYLEKTITVCEAGYAENCMNKDPTEKYYYTLSQAIWGPSMLSAINLLAVADSRGANLEIVDKSSTTDDKTTIMLSIQNTGDSNAILDDITSPIPLTITYKPPVIKPGETESIYLQTTQQVDVNSLSFDLSYRSETLSCQPPTTTTTTTTQPPMQITSCSSNSQCSTGLCCQNQCRDSTKGVCRDINGDGILDWVPYS
jgi:hypothetical protein